MTPCVWLLLLFQKVRCDACVCLTQCACCHCSDKQSPRAHAGMCDVLSPPLWGSAFTHLRDGGADLQQYDGSDACRESPVIMCHPLTRRSVAPWQGWGMKLTELAFLMQLGRQGQSAPFVSRSIKVHSWLLLGLGWENSVRCPPSHAFL